MSLQDLPHLNAALNATCTVLLLIGWWLINDGRRAALEGRRQRRIEQHRLCMIAAVITSALFLTSYVIYHANVGSKPFPGTGFIRTVYFTILIPHVILAAVTLPVIVITFIRGLNRDDVRHRRIARWTMPVWLFVSVTGVIVYGMLYRLY